MIHNCHRVRRIERRQKNFIYIPSGAKLHVGHWYNYGVTDSYARFMRMNGICAVLPRRTCKKVRFRFEEFKFVRSAHKLADRLEYIIPRI